MHYFEENIQLFSLKNSLAAAKLSLPISQSYVIENNNIFDPTCENYFYDYQDFKVALGNWAESTLRIDDTVRIMYGVGLGYEYQFQIPWLRKNSNHHLIIIEDDLALLALFLETKIAFELLTDVQVTLLYIEENSEGVELIKQIVWGAYKTAYRIIPSSGYQKVKKEKFDAIVERFTFEKEELEAVVDEYMMCGISYVRNFWRNIFLLDESYQGKDLFNNFHKIPALVVAAGPTLEKQLDLIRSLQNKVLIISGGSSTNILAQAGIRPHFSCGIDPNPMQYLRLRQSLAFETPFFIRTRMLHEAARIVSGKKLYLPGGDGYPLSDWIEDTFHLSGKILGGGHSVSNFIVEIAYMLGCRPIILAGYTLAYGENMKHYALGVDHVPSRSKTAISWKNHAGNTLITEWKWVQEAFWIEEFVAKHKKCTFVNATEGGLGFRGVKEYTLEEAVKKYCTQQYDIEALVQQSILHARPCKVDKGKLVEACVKFKRSLEKICALCEEIASYSSDEEEYDVFFEKGTQAVLMQTLQDEIAYKYLLEVFHKLQIKIARTKFDIFIHPKQSKVKKVEYNRTFLENHMQFLLQVARVNIALIEKVLQEQGKST